jgi:hypothetical protein
MPSLSAKSLHLQKQILKQRLRLSLDARNGQKIRTARIPIQMVYNNQVGHQFDSVSKFLILVLCAHKSRLMRWLILEK